MLSEEIHYEKKVPVKSINFIEEEIQLPIRRTIERTVENVVSKDIMIPIETEKIDHNVIEEVQYVNIPVHVKI